MAESNFSKLSPTDSDPEEFPPHRLSLTKRFFGACRDLKQKYLKWQEADDQSPDHEEEEEPAFNDRTHELNPAIFLKSQVERRRTSSVGSDDGHNKGVLRSSVGDQVTDMNLKRKDSLHGVLLNNFQPNTAVAIDGE